VASIQHALHVLGERGRARSAVTSKPRVYAQTIIDRHARRPSFRGVYGAELNGDRSDRGARVRYVLEREGLSPAGVLMVGARAHDVVGAREHGVACVAVGWGYGSRDELAPAKLDAIVESVPELIVRLRAPTQGASDTTRESRGSAV
jgi:phosphoglycolate phosphatase